ncbi:hypothetical protein NHX12_012694 [Muraenolepis orangiensis]|uniref:Secreted protein n=1 Tax=Muraenolepis orangiensis TaxID=630683 RepID=A0A9Q0DCG0_9TELE|nr:hypothetical protein NHX12_012694 [Muraenolepis orangiensis]
MGPPQLGDPLLLLLPVTPSGAFAPDVTSNHVGVGSSAFGASRERDTRVGGDVKHRLGGCYEKVSAIGGPR